MNTSELQKIKQRYNIVGNCDALNHALDVVIHDNSPRKREKYFAINCGAIPEGTIDSELFGHEKGSFTGAIGESQGYFGEANKGTIFLDEVGELPLATQARLLRVLETGEYIRVGGTKVMKTDVRIVAATNVNMQKAISEGRFREDLYYRLNTIPIQMPPLRDRGQDIILLFRLFAMQMAEKYKLPKITLTEEAKELILKYKWPGNVRQLKNITEQMSILSQDREITAEALLKFIPQSTESTMLATIQPAGGSHSYENERELLYKILYELKGNVGDLRREMNSLREQLQSPVNQQQTTITQHPAPIAQHPSPITQPMEAEAEEIQEMESLNLDDISRQMLIKALDKNGGNRKKAAQELGISDRTLYRRIKQYGLDE